MYVLHLDDHFLRHRFCIILPMFTKENESLLLRAPEEHKTIWVIHLSAALRGFTARYQACCPCNLLIKMLLAVYVAYLKSQGSRICPVLERTRFGDMQVIRASPGGSSLCLMVCCAFLLREPAQWLRTFFSRLKCDRCRSALVVHKAHDIWKSCCEGFAQQTQQFQSDVAFGHRPEIRWILQPRWSNCRSWFDLH